MWRVWVWEICCAEREPVIRETSETLKLTKMWTGYHLCRVNVLLQNRSRVVSTALSLLI